MGTRSSSLSSYLCPVCGSGLPRAASRCFFCDQPLPMYKRLNRSAGGAAADEPAALPPLFVPQRDFARLEQLARIGLVDSADKAARDLLRRELDRATVCAPEATPHGVVRMGVAVLAQQGDGNVLRRIEGVLTYPGERPESLSAIPVTSMLGAAILGLSADDVMPYEALDGSRHAVKIIKVFAPTSPGVEPPSAA